jgi:hypothetical protein
MNLEFLIYKENGVIVVSSWKQVDMNNPEDNIRYMNSDVQDILERVCCNGCKYSSNNLMDKKMIHLKSASQD